MPITTITVAAPIPTNSRTLIVSPVSADANGQLLDFSALGYMGRVSLRNVGPNPVYIMVGATATNFPTAARAVGSVVGGVYVPGTFVVQANEAFNFSDILFQRIGFICAAAQTAVLDVQATQNSGGTGE